MELEILLPGEQIQPLKKSNKKNKNNKNKPNGFICFANAQRAHLAAQFDLRGPEMLVTLCDPLWRKLTPDEKKMWNIKAKDEHARSIAGSRCGVRTDNASSRMDCNGKIIAERLNAERSSELRRQRERRYVNNELDRCAEVVDFEFCVIDCLTAIDYLDGECVPCEIGCVRASIRAGIIGSYHFFPDPGPLRPGHIADANIKSEQEHEIPWQDFHLASKEYEHDATKLLELIRGHENSPKVPMLFCRSSELKQVQASLDWLSYRVNTDFNLQVMELESFVVDLVAFTRNEPPTFAQIRRLLFETRYDFQAKTRCDFHCDTDKANCAIGNTKKYVFFLSEILYDYYEFELKEGKHYPIGFKRPKATGSSVCTGSVYDFDDTASERTDVISVSSFVQNRAPSAPNVRGFSQDSFSQDSFSQGSHSQNSRGRGRSRDYEVNPAPEILSQLSLNSQNSYMSNAEQECTGTVPRKPVVTKCYKNDGITYDTHKNDGITYDTCKNDGITYDTQKGSQNSFVSQPSRTTTPPPKINSFSQDSTRSVSPARSIGRGSQCRTIVGVPPPGFAPICSPTPQSSVGPGAAVSTKRGRGRGVPTELPRKPHGPTQKKDKF